MPTKTGGGGQEQLYDDENGLYLGKNTREYRQNISYSEIVKQDTGPEGQMRSNDAIKASINMIVGHEIDVDEVVQKAQQGIAHGGIYTDALRKRKAHLIKSIKSHEEQVRIHIDKLENPESYDAGWKIKTDIQKNWLIEKWKKDAKRNAEQAMIERSVFYERFRDEHPY